MVVAISMGTYIFSRILIKENASQHDRGSRASMTTWRGHFFNYDRSSIFSLYFSIFSLFVIFWAFNLSLFSNIHHRTPLPATPSIEVPSQRHKMILSSCFRRRHCNTTIPQQSCRWMIICFNLDSLCRIVYLWNRDNGGVWCKEGKRVREAIVICGLTFNLKTVSIELWTFMVCWSCSLLLGENGELGHSWNCWYCTLQFS
jgi:hypothetical protein